MKTFLISILYLFLIPAQVLAATLSLSPASGTFNPGCPFSLDILLNTSGEQTAGTDAILHYDTSKFTANSPISTGHFSFIFDCSVSVFNK